MKDKKVSTATFFEISNILGLSDEEEHLQPVANAMLEYIKKRDNALQKKILGVDMEPNYKGDHPLVGRRWINQCFKELE